MSEAKLTSKGQITIPKAVRERLGLRTGDRVEFVEEAPGVYRIVPVTRDVRALRGIVPRPACPVPLEDMERAVREGASRTARRR